MKAVLLEYTEIEGINAEDASDLCKETLQPG